MTCSELQGWLIVWTGFLIEALAIGGRSLFLIVIIVWEEENQINWTRAELSLLMALVHVCIGLVTPISGYLVDKYPPHRIIAAAIAFLSISYGLTSMLISKWQTWLIYGVLTGTAFGALNLNVFSSAIMKHITKHRGLAVGISTSGSTFGQFALVPLFAFGEQHIGWRKCFLILGGITLLTILPVLYLLPPTLSHKEEAKDCEESCVTIGDSAGAGGGLVEEAKDCEESSVTIGDSAGAGGGLVEEDYQPTSFLEDTKYILRKPQYLNLLFSFFVCGISTTGFIESHLIAYLKDEKKYSIATGSQTFSLLSACNGIAIITAGYLADRADRHKLLGCIFGLRGLTFLLLVWFVGKQDWLLWVFAVLFGIADYSVVPPTVSLCQTSFPTLVGTAVGVLLLVHSLGAALGSAFGGYIFDVSGSYTLAVYLCASMCLVVSVCLFCHNRIMIFFQTDGSSKRSEHQEYVQCEVSDTEKVVVAKTDPDIEA